MSIPWKDIQYDGGEAYIEDGENWREARVVQGGNDLWTVYVQQGILGRQRKNGPGRIARKTTCFKMRMPQFQTKEEAKAWAEESWNELQPMGSLEGKPAHRNHHHP